MSKSLDIIDPKREERNEPDEHIVDNDELKVETKSQGGVFYLVMGIVALVVATAAALYILYKDDNPNKNKTNEATVSEASVTASPSASPEASATPSLTVTSTPAAKTETSYKEDKVRVANGNGINGEGAKIKAILEKDGFTVTSVGNASKTYTKSIVFYKEGKESLANAIKEAIKGEYSADIELSPSTVGQYDAVLALGSK